MISYCKFKIDVRVTRDGKEQVARGARKQE